MSKTNKELAVDVAIAYIEASSKLVHGNGSSHGLTKFDNVQQIIQGVYNTLESLDSSDDK